jgi:hypothetical protein
LTIYGQVFQDSGMNDLDFVLKYYLPKSTRWWLGGLLKIGQAHGSDLVLSDLDMPCTDNVASADRVLGALEKAGVITRAGWHPDHSTRAFLGLEGRKPGSYTYPREHIFVPADRDRIKAILETP